MSGHEVLYEVCLDDESDAVNPITGPEGGPLDQRVTRYLRRQAELVDRAQGYIDEVGASAVVEALKERGVLVETEAEESWSEEGW